MANEVRFVQCTQLEFDESTTKDSNALYFTSDTHNIYKGGDLYTPASGLVPLDNSKLENYADKDNFNFITLDSLVRYCVGENLIHEDYEDEEGEYYNGVNTVTLVVKDKLEINHLGLKYYHYDITDKPSDINISPVLDKGTLIFITYDPDYTWKIICNSAKDSGYYAKGFFYFYGIPEDPENLLTTPIEWRDEDSFQNRDHYVIGEGLTTHFNTTYNTFELRSDVLKWGGIPIKCNFIVVVNDSVVKDETVNVPQGSEITLDASKYEGNVVKWTVETSDGTTKLSDTTKSIKVTIDRNCEYIVYLETE